LYSVFNFVPTKFFFIPELREAFFLFDIENVGEITVRELGAVLSAHGYSTTEETLAHMLNEIDEDGRYCSMTRHI
jgi:Ca2+-binding EF-hand superfamily protein